MQETTPMLFLYCSFQFEMLNECDRSNHWILFILGPKFCLFLEKGTWYLHTYNYLRNLYKASMEIPCSRELRTQ